MSKKKNSQNIPAKNTDAEISQLDTFYEVSSATECTGLVQTPPENESEAESYSDIYDIPVPPAENSQE